MKKDSAFPWWGWLSCLVVLLLGALAYMHLPIHVITKSNLIAPRFLVVLYEPSIMILVVILWHVLWRIDPKKRNYEFFWSTYRYVGGIIVVSIGLAYLATLGHVLHLVSIRFVPTAIGIMFMLIANVLPRIQPNWWVGFRTPWTLSSDESWNRTHRLGGQLGIPVGILIIILSWILPLDASMRLAIGVPVLLWVVITVTASYFYARNS